MEAEIINDILISIAVAAALAFIAHRLRQPVLLGYILAGIVIGPHLGLQWVTNPEAIDFSSELGLIALLFMVGLELDLRKIAQSGRAILIAAIAQFAICVALGLAFFNMPVFGGGLAPYYLAVVFSLSSTMIVVKLLYDKFELDTLPGRITLGILVVQDIWAIVFLAVQPSLANPELGALAFSFLKGAALIGGCLLMRYLLLPRIFKSVARSPELMVVVALGWCFLISWLSGDVVGLSRAMGALIAGFTLSTLPYGREINDRVTSIRSFFLILFFVSLGMKVAQPSLDIFVMSLLASLFLIATRFLSLFPPLYLTRKGIRVSFLVPLNLSQISEFALVIVALGVGYGHVGEDVLTVVLFTLMITATLSTYGITYSHSIYRAADRVLKRLGLKDVGEEEVGEEACRPILLLGFYKVASSLLHTMERQSPSLLEKITVVDFNPDVHQELGRRGVHAVFGDLANTSTLVESGLERAQVVVSTVPDTILKGTSNMSLLTYTKRVNPSARVIVTAEGVEAAKKLWAAGADFVIMPHAETSERLAPLVEQFLSEETIPDMCAEHRRRTMEHPGEVIK